MAIEFNPEIFRAYDIRGVYGKDFDDGFAFELGAALVRYLNRRSFLVSHDDRSFSSPLAEAVSRGITSAGGDVTYIGQATTPFFNFVFKTSGANGGIMVTASHLAPEYGGFKIFSDVGAINFDTGLSRLRDIVREGNMAASKHGGKTEKLDRGVILEQYTDFAIKKSGIEPGGLRGFAAKIEMPPIGTEELDLILAKTGLANEDQNHLAGFSFDGDTDRIYAKDANGQAIGADLVVGVLAWDMISFWRKPRVVHELRFSRGVIDKFEEWGIRHFRSPVGWSLLKQISIKNKADIAGELSGHILWKETNYAELPLLTMLNILRIITESSKNISQLVEPFRTWEGTGEINFQLSNLNFQKTSKHLEEKYRDGKIDKLDGITVEYPGWWFNLRPSNTEPILRLVVEAKTKNLLEEKVAELKILVGVDQRS